jgi:Zn-dependent peptidase ImmA (M78 family)
MITVVDRLQEARKSAPVDVERLIGDFGLELDLEARLPADITSQLIRIDESRFRIAINIDQPALRKRFSMAHALGHYLLHKDDLGVGVSDTMAYQTPRTGPLANPRITEQHEADANRFAANLLMPDALVQSFYMKTGGNLTEMSRVFQTSREMIRYAVHSLGLDFKDTTAA